MLYDSTIKMDALFTIFLLGTMVVGGTLSVRSKVKKYGWRAIRKKIWGSFLLFLRTFFIALVFIAYFAGFFTILYFFESSASDQLALGLFLFLYFVFGSLFWYYTSGIKRRGTRRISKMITGDIMGIKNTYDTFIKDLGLFFESILKLAGWSVMAIVWLVLIGLGIWLVVALGPLWIIAIILCLILFALLR